MIEIDGSYLEGGGAILRVGTALSAVTGKSCKVINIRKGRCNPGLRAQHLESLNALARFCDASVSGNKINSTEVKFSPSEINKKEINIKIPTAGSIGLLLQPLMIAAVHAKDSVKINIDGGAVNGKWAAPVNYIKHVLLLLLQKMNYKAEIEIEKYGYYPKGGAKVSVRIEPCKLKPISLLERGKIILINGISHASKNLEKANVAERQKKEAEKVLFREFEISPKIEIKYVDSVCPGSAIDLWLETENTILGADGLGERGKKSEDVGKEAAEKLLQQIKSNAAIDEHAEDQLLPYMALAAEGGTSNIYVPKLTGHTRTNIWVIEQFLPVKFDIDEWKKTIACKSL